MRIAVKSFMALIHTGKLLETELLLAPGDTLATVMDRLRIDAQEEVILLVNQCPSERNRPLKDGDKVVIMPPVSAA